MADRGLKKKTVSFAYNLGVTALTHSTLLALVNDGRPEPMVSREFPRWNKVRINGVLTPSWGLHRRRLAEQHLYVTGEIKTAFVRGDYGF
ncbi:MAG: glycoside hydrolase family protein [Panacagrimonas sp.]